MWPEREKAKMSSLGWLLRNSGKNIIANNTVTSYFSDFYVMWSGKISLSWTCDIISFLFDWSVHLESYILLKTPLESDQWFQSYEQILEEQLKDSQNNRKPKKKILFLAISHNQYSRLRLIGTHILKTLKWYSYI